jgi:hypothetical protein
MLLNENVEIQ